LIGLYFAVKRAAADAEKLRRLRHVALGQVKGLPDKVSFHGFQIQAGRGGVDRAGRGPAGQARRSWNPCRQVPHPDALSPAKRHGMLDRGVYLAPSAYETGFVSAAHAAAEIDATLAAAREAFKR